jgi:hypothetical protein
MKFTPHPELKDKHAFLSPSGSTWIRYDDEKLIDRLEMSMSAAHGTRLHAFAAEAISLGIKLPDNGTTLSMYVNDAIGYRMTPVVTLVASYNAFGTADAISFRREHEDDDRLTLRIHDLKTGVNTAKVDQLLIYAAYFCIEYQTNPNSINIEIAIYQNDTIAKYQVDTADVLTIMSQTEHFDDIITKYRLEALG